jgi:hypothetical protein
MAVGASIAIMALVFVAVAPAYGADGTDVDAADYNHALIARHPEVAGDENSPGCIPPPPWPYHPARRTGELCALADRGPADSNLDANGTVSYTTGLIAFYPCVAVARPKANTLEACVRDMSRAAAAAIDRVRIGSE